MGIKKFSLGSIPKLTKEQTRVLDEIINGAQIQLDYSNADSIAVDLIFENGNTEPIRNDTFNRLKETNLIKRLSTPAHCVELWS
ncbi:MAG: hypothetical protein WBA59_03780 [Moheibacter sp.]